MPTINVEIILRGEHENRDVDRVVKQPPNKNEWIPISPNQVSIYISQIRLISCFLIYSMIVTQEYTIQVNLNRLGQRSSKSIHCPKFPKGKDEGWFLTLGNQYDGELIALKRIGYRNNRSSHQLGFMAPGMKGTLYRKFITIYY